MEGAPHSPPAQELLSMNEKFARVLRVMNDPHFRQVLKDMKQTVIDNKEKNERNGTHTLPNFCIGFGQEHVGMLLDMQHALGEANLYGAIMALFGMMHSIQTHKDKHRPQFPAQLEKGQINNAFAELVECMKDPGIQHYLRTQTIQTAEFAQSEVVARVRTLLKTLDPATALLRLFSLKQGIVHPDVE